MYKNISYTWQKYHNRRGGCNMDRSHPFLVCQSVFSDCYHSKINVSNPKNRSHCPWVEVRSLKVDPDIQIWMAPVYLHVLYTESLEAAFFFSIFRGMGEGKHRNLSALFAEFGNITSEISTHSAVERFDFRAFVLSESQSKYGVWAGSCWVFWKSKSIYRSNDDGGERFRLIVWSSNGCGTQVGILFVLHKSWSQFQAMGCTGHREFVRYQSEPIVGRSCTYVSMFWTYGTTNDCRSTDSTSSCKKTTMMAMRW